uniref:Solute carrier family 3 member 2 N-terminal domain-containing protein n=1 Tax=Oryzias sinensis TaxID=183150 RepID=A0A8C8DL05_9TELE
DIEKKSKRIFPLITCAGARGEHREPLFHLDCANLLQMPVNAADTSYGSVPGTGLLGGGGSMETSPLLEPDPEPVQHWRPLSKQQLEAAAGGPGWRKVRHYLVLTVWLACIVMFSVAVGIIVLSPRPSATCLRWWQKSLFYQLQADLYMETQHKTFLYITLSL